MSRASGKSLVYYSAFDLLTYTMSYRSPFTGNVTGLNSQDLPRIDHREGISATVWEQVADGGKQIMAAVTADGHHFPGAVVDTVTASDLSTAYENADVALSTDKIHVVWQDNVSGTIRYYGSQLYPSRFGGAIA